jgi:uncharacterized protein
MKYVVLVVVIVLAWWLLLRRPHRGGGRRADRASPKGPTTFLVCAHCGVHVPAPDAVRDGELSYCSDAHRLAGPQDSAR